jgi:hypothetical protein
MHTAPMEKLNDTEGGSEPPLSSSDYGERFVAATPAEIAYAEELLRQIEQRYLKHPVEI